MWILAFILFAVNVYADKFAYPPQKLSAQGVTEIRVSGVKGRLKLKQKLAKFYRIKVTHSKSKRFEDWNLSVDRQGGALVLEVFNVAFGARWRNNVREELWPEFDVELEGPAQPAVIGWREGEIEVAGWDSSLEAAFIKGSFKSKNGKGNFQIQAGDARVSVDKHTGALQLKGEKGRVDLNDFNGELNLNWLDGAVRAKNLQGSLQLDLPAGHAQLEKVAATVKAKGATSEWDVGLRAPSDVEVITDSGPVRIRWESGAAKLFLTSQNGEIKVPKAFRVETREGVKVVEATSEKSLANSARGSVFVRTQSGNISWQ